MQISYKPIRLKQNEWLPQERVYWNKLILNDIIKKESLDQNMICIQNVGFNSDSQTFTNVQIECTNYLDDFIYLIKAKNILVNQEYFWAYVTNKTYNTAKKVVLDLKIDVISSNWENFDNERFKGQFYLERMNYKENPHIKDKLRIVNNIHSDACASIKNTTFKITDLDFKINKNIDIFIDNKVAAKFTKQMISDEAPGNIQNFDIEQKGTIIFQNTFPPLKFLAYKSTVSFTNKITEMANLIVDIDTSLGKYSRSQYSDDIWRFNTLNDITNFSNEVIVQGTNAFSDVDKIITSENTNFWISIPKIFDVDSNIISEFTIDIDNLNLNSSLLTVHNWLHYNYYLIFQDFLKIPLDLQKMDFIKKKIYGVRIINNDGAIFKFYYREDRVDDFYTVNLTLTNGLLSTDYQAYIRQLNLQYNSGLKGITNGIPDFTQQLIDNTTGFLVNNAFGFYNTFLNVINLPFSIYQRYKNEQYQKNSILSKPKESKNTLLLEALYAILTGEISFANYGYTGNGRISGWSVLNYRDFNKNQTDNFKILLEIPDEESIDQIKLDQKEFGQVYNQLFLDIPNPLFIDRTIPTNYIQGKILPNKNPVNNFMLDVINNTLAQGIKIKNDEPK